MYLLWDRVDLRESINMFIALLCHFNILGLGNKEQEEYVM